MTRCEAMLVEAYLAEGNLDPAAREAEIALDIAPALHQARSALARIGGVPMAPGLIEKLVERGQLPLSDGEPL